MKKTIILTVLLCGLAATGSRAQSYPKLKNDTDSVSFFIGLDVGRSVGSMNGIAIDADLVAKGLVAAMRAGDTLDTEEYMAYLREYFSVRIPRKQLAQSEEYLATVAAIPGVMQTESGLYYKIIDQGDMNYRATQDDDSVEVIYKGTLADGTLFDSNDEGVVFQLNRVISGWGEGLKLVGKGGRILLYIHPSLAYGERGHGSVIPGNSALVFDVSVLDAPEAY